MLSYKDNYKRRWWGNEDKDIFIYLEESFQEEGEEVKIWTVEVFLVTCLGVIYVNIYTII